LSLLVLWSAGCAYFGTDAPLDLLTYSSETTERRPHLIIFLRGQGGSHKSFQKEGFVSAVRRRNLPFDMVAPNAHMGYYVAESLVPRLKQDVIDPAMADGYDRIWLVGASMGGMGALWYTRLHPEDIAGVYLISPFLGDPEIIDEIAGAGGMRSWSPGAYDPSEDWERLLWDWLKRYAENPEGRPPIYLGYGRDDRFGKAHRLLAEGLPQERVFRVPGGHDPETMRRLWQRFLSDNRLR
jgi:pimeloyl-ACP methyl ester carboxylesterase